VLRVKRVGDIRRSWEWLLGADDGVRMDRELAGDGDHDDLGGLPAAVGCRTKPASISLVCLALSAHMNRARHGRSPPMRLIPTVPRLEPSGECSLGERPAMAAEAKPDFWRSSSRSRVAIDRNAINPGPPGTPGRAPARERVAASDQLAQLPQAGGGRNPSRWRLGPAEPGDQGGVPRVPGEPRLAAVGSRSVLLRAGSLSPLGLTRAGWTTLTRTPGACAAASGGAASCR
jgi:hypothetical protein